MLTVTFLPHIPSRTYDFGSEASCERRANYLGR